MVCNYFTCKVTPAAFRFIFILATTFLLALHANAQSDDEYTIKRYTSKNGLPQNSILSMVMDDNRYLWMTTEGGLVRFDGQHFKIFNHFNYPEIQNDRFRNIIKTYDGRLLTIDLTGTLLELKNGKVELLRKGESLNPPNRIYSGGVPDVDFFIKRLQNLPDSNIQNKYSPLYSFIYPISLNRYAVRNEKGISIINLNKLERLIEIPQATTVEIFILNSNFYYFNNSAQLYYLDISTGNSHLAKITGDLNRDSLIKQYGPRKVIWSYTYPDAHLKLQNRLYKLEPGNHPTELISTLIITNLPSNCLVSDAFFDKKSQSLFVGTDTKGLYIYKKHSLKTLIYNTSKGNVSNAFYSQCILDSNTILTPSQLAFTIQGGETSDIIKVNASNEAMLNDRNGNIWYARGNQVFCYDIKTRQTTTINCSTRYNISCFYEEGDSVFVSWDTEIGYIKNFKYTHIVNIEKRGIDARIEFMMRGPDGLLWMTMCEGVARIHPGTNKIEMMDELKGVCARVLFRDEGKIFIGSYGHGFYCWENGKLTHFPLDKDKILSYVHSFLIDNNGYMWMSTNKGLFKTSYKSLLDYINNPDQNIHYQYFGEDEGIVNTEFNGGCVPAVIRLKNGYVSYPSMEGFVWFKPEEVHSEPPDEEISIDAILVDGIEMPMQADLLIPSKHENIEVIFSSPYWGNPYNLKMEYQLTGLNKNWIKVGASENSLPFSTLPSGTYELKLRKKVFDEEEPYIYASLTFRVEKKYYETSWFILLSVLASLGFFIGIIILNSRRILNKNIALENKIAERTTELAEANSQLEENYSKLSEKEKSLRENIHVKDRLISVISHDIITPLKFISMVSRISKNKPELLDKKKLVDSMNDIEFASDKLFNNANNILNWMKLQNKRIKPKLDHIAIHDFVDDLLDPLIGMAEIKGITIKNEVPEEDLIVSDKYILMIILQNLLSNAIKYTEKGEIVFSAWQENGQYFISVSDKGIGMTPNMLKEIEHIIKSKESLADTEPDFENGNRLGYYIIADFLQLLRGNISITSEKGKGTTVILHFPQYQR